MEGAAGRDLGPWDHGTVSFESRDRRRTLSAKQWAEAGYKRPRPQSSPMDPMFQIPRFTGNCPNFRFFFPCNWFSFSHFLGFAKIGDPKSKNQQLVVPRPQAFRGASLTLRSRMTAPVSGPWSVKTSTV